MILTSHAGISNFYESHFIIKLKIQKFFHNKIKYIFAYEQLHCCQLINWNFAIANPELRWNKKQFEDRRGVFIAINRKIILKNIFFAVLADVHMFVMFLCIKKSFTLIDEMLIK